MHDDYPPLAALPQLTLHPSVDPGRLDAAKIVNDWLSSFTESLSQRRSEDMLGHFLETESWWRDFVSFSWDIACHNGAETICSYLSSSTVGFAEPKADQPGTLQPQLADMGGLRFIQSGFGFKTRFGTGRGVLRLANVGPDQWKAWTVFTVLEQLNGHDELFLRRAKEAEIQGGASSHGTPAASDQTDSNLQVLVVGAGETSSLFLYRRIANITRPIWTCTRCASAAPRHHISGRGQDISSWRLLASQIRHHQIAHSYILRSLSVPEIPQQLAALPR